MSEYAKNIQTIEDMWKKRIELRGEGGGGMSMKVTMCEFVHGMTCKEVCEFMSNIVRCRDCKHSDKAYWCKHFGSYGDLPPVTPDGFCAWGERNDGETVEVWKQSSPDDVTCYEGKE